MVEFMHYKTYPRRTKGEARISNNLNCWMSVKDCKRMAMTYVFSDVPSHTEIPVHCVWVEQGASLVGGCCRTGPEHIRQIRRRMSGGSAV